MMPSLLLLQEKNVVHSIYALYSILEINASGLGSTIQDMEAEWKPNVITDLIIWWIFGKQMLS